MSYILEALRKADAERERERGAVPDLHAQLIPLTGARGGEDDDDLAPRMRAVAWIAAGLAIVLLGAAAWWWFGTGDTPAAVLSKAEPAPATPAAAAQPAPLPAASDAASAASAAQSPTLAGATTALAAASAPAASAAVGPPRPAEPVKPSSTQSVKAAPEPKAAAKPAPKPAPRPADTLKPREAGPDAAPAARTQSAAARPPAPAPEARAPRLSELPEDVRQQVPAMALGGSVYSPEPARRMVIVNGQVFGEGSTLAPELKLETINPKSAVFSIRGQRFLVPL